MSMLLNPYFNSKTSCYWTWLFPPSKQFFAWLSQPALFCFYSSVSWLSPPHTPGTCFRTRCWDFFSKATHFVGDLIMSKGFKSHLYETMTSQFFLLSCFFVLGLQICISNNLPISSLGCLIGKSNCACWKSKSSFFSSYLLFLCFFSISLNGSFFPLIAWAKNVQVFLDFVSFILHV